jgi:hypothetical protein
MRVLKFLQISACMAAIAALAAVAGLSACSGARPPASQAAASTAGDDGTDAVVAAAATAEKYAVSLANDRCEREFGKRPFRSGRFPAIQSGDRWLWGWLDGRETGYTAQVSFRTNRTQPDARVYPAADEAFDMEAPNAPDLDFRPDPDVITQQPETE